MILAKKILVLSCLCALSGYAFACKDTPAEHPQPVQRLEPSDVETATITNHPMAHDKPPIEEQNDNESSPNEEPLSVHRLLVLLVLPFVLAIPLGS